MHKLIQATRRRSVSVAAGLILAGGMAGGVLLTAGPAAAATTTTTLVSATAQGSTINVRASVSPSGGGGSISVSGAGGSCSIQVGGGGMFGGGGGGCQITGVTTPGSYTLTATYTPTNTAYMGSSAMTSVTVGGNSNPPNNPPQNGNAPQFTQDSPPSSVSGSSFSYQFQANNDASYQLVGGPNWLGINNGMVSGNIPNGITSFSFSVYAWNQWGHVQVGPFWVYFHPHQNYYNHHNYNNYSETNIHTSLYCTSPVYNGGGGSCTLRVSNSNQNFFWGPGQYNQNFGPNFGQDYAADVTAQISLPWQLKADYCGYSYYNYYNGCHIYGNTAYENLGNLYPGHSASLTVHFTVRSGFNIWGNHSGNSFYVKVTGSASSNHNNFMFFGQGQSYATTYVQIRPYGFWW